MKPDREEAIAKIELLRGDVAIGLGQQVSDPYHDDIIMMSSAAVAAAPGVRTDPGFRQTEQSRETLAKRDNASDQVECTVASCREELYAALRLVYQNYLDSGLIKKNPYQLRVTPFHALQTTEVLVARNRDEVVCTMSLVRDGYLGLPMQTIYAQEVEARRRQGIRLAEVVCLANRHQEMDISFPIMLRLMGLIAQCASLRGVDQFLIAVHPRHAKFYQRFLAFEVIGEEKAYGTVCNNPAVPLALDLNRLPKDNPRVYKRLFGEPFSQQVLQYWPIPDRLRAELRAIADALLRQQPQGVGLAELIL